MAGGGSGHSGYVWFISVIAALGGLLFGYDWVVIGGAKPFYEIYFKLTDPWLQGWAMSCALAGCLAGAMISGFLSEHFGRKPSLLAAALVFTVSSLGTASAGSFHSFVAWRITGGLAIGLASCLSPMYIAEVAPAAIRGRLVCLNQLTIVIGLLLAQIVNWLIAKPIAPNATAAGILVSWNGQHGWRWMFGATAVPAAAFLLGMLMVPESPRWLARKGKTGPARRILARINGEAGVAGVLEEIEASAGRPISAGELGILLAPPLRKVLLLGVALAVLQQWCGINVIFNYAQEVFSAAGYGLSSILSNIVVTGVVNVVFTFLAIATVDRIGRRALMLGGCAGLFLTYSALGYCYSVHSQGFHMLLLVVTAIACYSMTLAPVTWVILSEIFPSHVRGAAMAVATAALWLACFILTATFPALNRSAGAAWTFWFYAAICASGFFLVRSRLPETKHKTLEAIESSWK